MIKTNMIILLLIIVLKLYEKSSIGKYSQGYLGLLYGYSRLSTFGRVISSDRFLYNKHVLIWQNTPMKHITLLGIYPIMSVELLAGE